MNHNIIPATARIAARRQYVAAQCPEAYPSASLTLLAVRLPLFLGRFAAHCQLLGCRLVDDRD